jgi:hypothetical protein
VPTRIVRDLLSGYAALLIDINFVKSVIKKRHIKMNIIIFFFGIINHPNMPRLYNCHWSIARRY